MPSLWPQIAAKRILGPPRWGQSAVDAGAASLTDDS